MQKQVVWPWVVAGCGLVGTIFLGSCLACSMAWRDAGRQIEERKANPPPRAAVPAPNVAPVVDDSAFCPTVGKFSLLRTGMTQPEIEGVMGVGGDVTAESEVGGITTRSLTFKCAGPYRVVSVMIQNGRMVMKNQNGL